MKRLFALLLTLAMLLSSAAMAEFDYTGLWTLTGAEAMGRPVDIAALGLNVSVLLKADGSSVLTMEDETENGTWAATQTGVNITNAAGVVDTYTLENNSLVAEQLGVKLIFARGVEEEISYVGLWELTSATGTDVTLDSAKLKEYGLDASLSIREDGTWVMDYTSRGEKEQGAWEEAEGAIILNRPVADAIYTYTLTDAALVLEQSGLTMIFTHVEPVAGPVGSWALTSTQYAGMTMDSAELKKNGVDISLSIREDGTWVMDSMGDKDQGIWEETEDAIVLMSPATYTLKDGALVFEQDSITMIYTPVAEPTVEPVEEAAAEPVAESTVEPVAEPTAEPEMEPTTEPEMDPLAEEEYAGLLAGLTLADFNGEWVLVDMEYMGQTMDAEMLGKSINLHIQDGKGHVEMTFADGTETQDAVCEILEIEELGTVMCFLYTDPATGEATESGMTLMLYSNGKLVWNDVDEENNDIFYNFEKVTNVSE